MTNTTKAQCSGDRDRQRRIVLVVTGKPQQAQAIIEAAAQAERERIDRYTRPVG